jgi:hypothetical protein
LRIAPVSATVRRANQQGLLIIERILRDRGGIWRQIAEERSLKDLSAQMLVSSAISLAVYGAVIGASNGFAQALSSAVKLPLLFLATLAICLPTLYLFNLLFGARLSMMQAVALIMVSITVTAVLTLAFAPISLFFLISAHSYPFLKLPPIAILVLTASSGRFLIGRMATISAYHAVRRPGDEPAPAESRWPWGRRRSRPRRRQRLTTRSIGADSASGDGRPTVAVAVRAPGAGRPADRDGARPAGRGPVSGQPAWPCCTSDLCSGSSAQLGWTLLRPFFAARMSRSSCSATRWHVLRRPVRTIGQFFGGECERWLSGS